MKTTRLQIDGRLIKIEGGGNHAEVIANHLAQGPVEAVEEPLPVPDLSHHVSGHSDAPNAQPEPAFNVPLGNEAETALEMPVLSFAE